MVNIVEVGPRDGLQNESATIPTETKVAFVDALSGTGVGDTPISLAASFLEQWMIIQFALWCRRLRYDISQPAKHPNL